MTSIFFIREWAETRLSDLFKGPVEMWGGPMAVETQMLTLMEVWALSFDTQAEVVGLFLEVKAEVGYEGVNSLSSEELEGDSFLKILSNIAKLMQASLQPGYR